MWCMSKTDVYSWRLDADLKRRLEEAAREEGASLSGLLDRITRDWLGAKRPEEGESARQKRLQIQAERTIGTLDLGEGPYSRTLIRERVRSRVQERRRKHGSPRSD